MTHLSKSDPESTLHSPLAEPLPQIVLEPFCTGTGWYLRIDGQIVAAVCSDSFINAVKEVIAQGAAFASARRRA